MVDKVKMVAEILEENEAALVYTPINRRYLTSFPSSLGYLLFDKHRAVLLIDSRYYLAASMAVKNVEVVLLKKLSEQLSQLIDEMGIKKISVEQELTIGELERFKKMFGQVEFNCDSKLSDQLLKLRRVKTPFEVECIKSAQSIAEKAFLEMLDFIKVGVTEKQVANELEYRMKNLGSEGFAFETIAVSGNRTAMPHGVPSDKKIEAGDFLTLDFGAVYNGYNSDMTRTVAVGYATDEMKEVYNTVLSANLNVIDKIKAGMTCKDADALARDVITAAGYGKYFTHSTGHSLGLEVHESPAVSPNCEELLQIGNIVTDEPGIYIDGKFGVRIEDMLLITENGCENLTKAEKKLIIV